MKLQTCACADSELRGPPISPPYDGWAANTYVTCLMLQAAFPLMLAVSNHPRGVFVLLSLLDQLSARIWDDPVNCEPGLKASGAACQGLQGLGCVWRGSGWVQVAGQCSLYSLSWSLRCPL